MSLTKVSEKERPMLCTPKQMAVLKSIIRGNDDGTQVDVYQLMALHGQGATRAAMRFTLGHLAAHGVIEIAGMESRRKHGPPLRLFQATESGKRLVRPRSLPTAGPP